MSKNITGIVKSITVVPETGGTSDPPAQEVTLVLRYTGEDDLIENIIEDEELNIEIPSHAPPPQQ